MNRIAIYLNKCLDGVVYSAPGILDQYSTDRSLLKIHPRVVALPENTMDLRRLVRFSHQLSAKNINLPITVRGSGCSKTGSDIGSGIIVSTERMNAIQEVDIRQRLVRVQCGVKLGELKKALGLCGLDLPVFGNPFETIGGLIAKSASASNNTTPSTIHDFIDRAEVVLSDGSVAEVRALSHHFARRMTNGDKFENEIYEKVTELIEEERESIAKIADNKLNRFGYSGLSAVDGKHGFSLVPLICGSEGTLGIVSEVILRVEPVFESPDYVAIHCKTATIYKQVCDELKRLRFTDAVVYDTELFNEIDATGKTSRFFRKVGDDGFLVVANAKDDSLRERKKKFAKLRRALPDSISIIRQDDSNERDFLELDCILNAYLNESAAGSYHLPLIDGVYIPPENQVEFFGKLNELADKLKLKLAVFGSVDFNTFSVRPSFKPATADGRKEIIRFLAEYLKLISAVEGYPCGEAPEGRFMAIFAKKFEDERTLELYRRVKKIFDPDGILNPGIKHETDVHNTLKHFRSDYNQGIEEKQ
ncbi:FAD-binding oxidoreductase [Candidatus Saccharibacteria bacterium]|nr:FAD-binding oxidoreductase [Candidatus Saccharibacteria bacterium]